MSSKQQNTHSEYKLTILIKALSYQYDKGIFFINSSSDVQFLSYGSLYSKALHVLNNLQQKGISKGDEVIFQIVDNEQFILLFWACILGGIIPVPLSLGNHENHKLKIFKVWKLLNNPYLVTEANNLSRLQSSINSNTNTLDQARILLMSELSVLHRPAKVIEAKPNQIAYIQFSSGSTGNPNGVVLSHYNLVNNIVDIASRSSITSTDSMLSWMPLTHDMGLICFHLTGVLTGINQYILPTSVFVRRPILWIDKASEYRVTLLYSPNFGYQYFLNAFKNTQASNYSNWNLFNLRLIYNGAEPISVDLLNKFCDSLKKFGLKENVFFPGYGLAEASVAVSLPTPGNPVKSHIISRQSLQPGRKVASLPKGDVNGVSFVEVGTPMAHCEVRIVHQNKVCSDSVVGHIQIKGANVTTGYYNDKVATQKVFTEDGWLKTGDIGYIKDENLTIIGREKNMMILFGQNYFSHDIERIIQEEAGVALGKVVACGIPEKNTFEEKLVVFTLFKGSEKDFIPLLEKIKEAVHDKIGIEVDVVVPIRKIPRTTSGKTQHFLLTKQFNEGFFKEKIIVLEQLLQSDDLTNSEGLFTTEKLLRIWDNIFKKPIELEADFIQEGLDSLKAARFLSRIEEIIPAKINISDIFEHSNILLLGSYIDKTRKTTPPISFDISPVEGPVKASIEQERFWVLDKYETNQTAYNIHLSHLITGEVDVAAFEYSFKELCKRHEILRTTFGFSNDGLEQLPQSVENENYKLKFYDLSLEQNALELAQEMIVKSTADSFDLATGPLVKAKMFYVSQNKYVFHISLHHIIGDGWSLGIIMQDIAAFYKNYISPTSMTISPLEFQHKDYIYWREDIKSKAQYTESKDYWLNELSGDVPLLNLSTKPHRSAFQTFKGKKRKVVFEDGKVDKLKQISRENNVTLFMTLTSLIYILLHKYSGDTDIILGTDSAGRYLKKLENQVGYYIKTFPIRVKFDSTVSFHELLQIVKHKLLGAYKHQDYSYDDMVKTLELNHDKSRNPLFDVLILFQNFEHKIHFEDLQEFFQASELDVEVTTSFVDLSFEFVENDGSISLNITYNPELFDEEEIVRLQNWLILLIGQVSNKNSSSAISEFNLLATNEATTILESFNRPAIHYSTQSLSDLLGIVALRQPHRIAIQCSNNTLTYYELDQVSDKIAKYLIKEHKVLPQKKIGLSMQRTENLIVAILSIMKSGAIYVPLDPDYPANRIAYIIEDCNLDFLYTEKKLNEKQPLLFESTIIHEIAKEAIDHTLYEDITLPAIAPSDIAYIIYTSGSTGEPKGVMIQHVSLLDYIHSFRNYFQLTSVDNVLQQSSIGFDISIEEIFPIITAGGKLTILQDGGFNIERLVEEVICEQITIISVTPLIIQELNNYSFPSSLRVIICGGDVLKPTHISQLFSKVPIYNSYGPTESTVCTTYHKLTAADESAIIGYPIDNRKVYILNDDLKLVPIGQQGELCIGGKGLALGYVNRLEETKNKFVLSPFNQEEKIYKTGDKGRWLKDGRIEFLGRKDEQLKIRGYRIEPGEVEHAILNHKDVLDAIVTIGNKHGQETFLIAYYVSKNCEPKQLKNFLQQNLPAYMIPTFCVKLEKFPLTPNGKVNSKALPDPLQKPMADEAVGKLPQYPIEFQILPIWKEILQTDSSDVLGNFFELGGDSIKAAKLITNLNKTLDVSVTFKDFFLNPTIRELSVKLKQDSSSMFEPVPVAHKNNSYPASNAQQRIWIMDRFSPEENIYHLFWNYNIQGDFDLNIFNLAFKAIIDRHETLRTYFEQIEEELYQRITAKESAPYEIDYLDIKGEKDVQYQLKEECQRFFTTKLDLFEWPLFHIKIIHYAPQSYRLLFCIHHIIIDGWSINLLLEELSIGYNSRKKGVSDEISPLKLQYKDYTAWQNALLGSNKIGVAKSFWAKQFEGDLPLLDLPADNIRPAIQTYEGALVSCVLDNKLRTGLKAIGIKHKVSLFSILLACAKVLLYKYTHQTDITVGTPVSGRVHKDIEDQLGLYINVLPIRTIFNSDKSFIDLLKQVNNSFLLACDNQQYPFDRLVEDLNLKRDLSRSPLFDVMVSFHNINQANESLKNFEGLTIHPLPKQRNISLFDISIDFIEEDEKITLEFEYNTNLFLASKIKRMLANYTVILKEIVKKDNVIVSQVSCLNQRQQNHLLVGFNDNALELPVDITINDLWEEQVGNKSNLPALTFENTTLTYQQLDERANQLAFYLKKTYNCKPNDLVGIMIERSEWMVICIMGIIKSGAAYVPIDPVYPIERINYLVNNSNIGLLICDSTVYHNNELQVANLFELKRLIDNCPKGSLGKMSSSSDLLYVIYTSGSTGNPKGAMIEHKNAVNLTAALKEEYALDKINICLLQMASMSFDVFFGDICRTLLTGGHLIICPDTVRFTPVELYQLIAARQINIFESTPSLILPLLNYVHLNNLDLSFMKLIIFGSDKLQAKDFNRVLSWFGSNIRIVNSYGTTETTVDASYFETRPKQPSISGNVPIGKPLPNVSLYILDGHLQLVPIGVTGELYIGGAGVGAGYINNKELTESRFILHPFKAGEKLYKTGDLCRWDEEGNVLFLGRNDFQVKIRGYRIELGEVEGHLLTHSGIREAFVKAASDHEGETYMVGYIVTSETLSVEEVRNHLKKHLPKYMLPSYIIEMESFPLTVNGKVDVSAFPDIGAVKRSDDFVEPRDGLERQLAWIWEEVLGHGGIGATDNFFEIGGHSLRATQVLSRIYRELGYRLELKLMFTHPSISGLAEIIRQESKTVYSGIAPIEEQDHYQLSHAQQRLWILNQLDTDQLAYNMPANYVLKGDLNIKALSWSFKNLIKRHESLRTVFINVDDEVYQRVLPFTALNFNIVYTDLEKEPAHESLLPSLIQEKKAKKFDLSNGPLIRVELLRLSANHHMLLFNMHHIISDGWSTDVLLQGIINSYNTHKSDHEPIDHSLTIQYKDYSAWQNKQLTNNLLSKQRDFWLEKFSGAIPLLNLPADNLRPAEKSYEGELLTIQLHTNTVNALGKICQEESCSLFMTLVATVKAMLYRYSGQEDMIVGFPVAGRQESELENQIGFYVNTLILRTQIDPLGSFSELQQQIKTNILEAHANQQYPFDKLIEDLAPERDISRSPLFDVMIVSQKNVLERAGFDDFQGIAVSEYHEKGTVSKFDLTFNFLEEGQGIILQLEYSTKLFSRQRIQRLVVHYENLVQSITQHQDKAIVYLPYLSPGEVNTIGTGFNKTKQNYPSEKTLQPLFEEQVAQTPKAKCVISEGKTFSYGYVNNTANQLAHYLRTNYSVKPNDRIGLMTSRGVEMIAGIFGILKSGAAYVPIDIGHPTDRQQYIIENSTLKAIVTDGINEKPVTTVPLIDINDVLVQEQPLHNPPVVNQPSDLAYVLYTSGTTGWPKGAMISHRSVANLIWWLSTNIYQKNSKPLTALLTASIQFDASVQQLFAPLINGSSLVLISDSDKKAIEPYIAALQKYKVDVIDITPSYLHAVLLKLEEAQLQLCLRYTLVGGEQLRPSLLFLYKKLIVEGELINVYGVTEATVNSTSEIIGDGYKKNSIGKPLPNVSLYILDGHLQLVPIGVTGELYIGGAGVGAGYINNKELTESRFILHPFKAGEKLYKTGDLCRWDEEGNVLFLGRNDFQVKIRGYRIELGEVEGHLLTHSGIREAFVKAASDHEGETYMVGYIVTSETLSVEEVRNHLKKHLPKYMLPSYIIEMESFPLTVNGKVDVSAFPDIGAVKRSDDFVEPRDGLERQLAWIWEEVLGHGGIGATDNFFEIGGHSLRATQVLSRIYRELGYRLELKLMFTHPSISGLAEIIRQESKTVYSGIAPIEEQDHYQLSHAQQRLWILNQLDTDQLAYNIHAMYELEGSLNLEHLRMACFDVIKRHESLRTEFHIINGEPRQKILSFQETTLDFQHIDIITEANKDRRLQFLVEEENSKAFNLRNAPLFRIKLISIQKRKHILLFTINHIISDGWSDGILVNELSDFYNGYSLGNAPVLPVLKVQYKDYAVWKNKTLALDEIVEQKSYWLNQLKEPLPLSNFPTDNLRPRVKKYEGDLVTFSFNKKTTIGIQELAGENACTLFMTLTGIVKILLYKYTEQTDVIVASPIAGREHTDLENLIGFFANTLIFRTNFKGDDTVAQLLKNVKSTTLDGYKNQSYPFDLLIEEMQADFNESHSPLTDVMVVFQNTELPDVRFKNVKGTPIAETSSTNSRFDIVFIFYVRKNRLCVDLTYNTSIFERDRMVRLTHHLDRLTKEIITDDSKRICDLPYLTDEEEASQVHTTPQLSETIADTLNWVCLQTKETDHDTLFEEIKKSDRAIFHIPIPVFYSLVIAAHHNKISLNDHIINIILSGGRLDGHLLQLWVQKYPLNQIGLYNAYFKTGEDLPVAVHRVETADLNENSVPVGFGVLGYELLVVNSLKQQLPFKTPGNIYVRNILKNDLQKTDDIGYRLPNGEIVLVGSSVDETFIQNYSVNTEEIAGSINRIPGVGNSRVYLKTSPEKELIACITPEKEAAYTVKQILRNKEVVGITFPLLTLPDGISLYHKNETETIFTWKEIFEENTYSKFDLDLKPGAVVFDVGANIGLFSLYIALHYSGVKLYAFEPLPPLFEVLSLNMTLYKDVDVTCINAGLSNREANVDFRYYPHNTILSGQFSNVDEEKATIRQYIENETRLAGETISENYLEDILDKSSTTEKYDCQVTTISSIISKYHIKSIDVLKIDVEKGELNVLEGIKDKDWKKVQQVIVEVHDISKRLSKIKHLLIEKGFETYIEQENMLRHTNIFNIYGKRTKATATETETRATPFLNQTQAFTNPEQWLNSVMEQSQNLLPRYMLPNHFFMMDNIPLTPDGNWDKAKILKLADTGRPKKKPVLPIKIIASFTAEPLEETLHWWGEKFELDLKLTFGIYNQFFQELLQPLEDGDSLVRLLLFRFEDVLRYKDYTREKECIGLLDNFFVELTQLMKDKEASITYFVGVLPFNENSDLPRKIKNKLISIYSQWRELLLTWKHIYSVDLTAIVRQYDVTAIFDAHSDKLGHIPYTEEFYAIAATALFRCLRSWKNNHFKVIALDCDNTLWKGICGEDGALNVRIPKNYADLQKFMLQKYGEGFLLVLCSKNNEKDVWETFDDNPEMLLKREHFAAHRINWKSKSSNLMELAEELNVGIDSFCFIDDSHVECAEVMLNRPEVLALTLPESENDIPAFLHHIWALDKAEITNEDRSRSEMYKAEKQRERLKQNETGQSGFLRSLELKVSMNLLNEVELPRASQLTFRTNQFNFSAKRRTGPELSAYLNGNSNRVCWTIDVTDKFGTYGLTGLVISERNETSLYIDTLLLSCRVLSREVETTILGGLKSYCDEHNIENIVADYINNEKNKLVLTFFEKYDWKLLEENGNLVQYCLSVRSIPDVPHYIDFYYKESLPTILKASELGHRNDVVFLPNHVGIAVNQIGSMQKYFKTIGFKATKTIDDPLQQVSLSMCTQAGFDSLELIAPYDDTSPIQNILSKNSDTPYHLCFQVVNFKQTLEYLTNHNIEYEVVSKPKKALLFDNKKVMFLLAESVGLIELLEDESTKVSYEKEENKMSRCVLLTYDLDCSTKFFKTLGYHQTKKTVSKETGGYRALLQFGATGHTVEIIAPAKNGTSMENKFLRLNGAHLYQVVFDDNIVNLPSGLPFLGYYHNETDEVGIRNWDWNYQLMNGPALFHSAFYEPLIYNSGRKLLRLPFDHILLENNKGRQKPSNVVEERLLKIFAEVLKKEVTVQDRFFEIGGNSIKATQILSRIYSEFDAEILLSDFFNSPTISGLAILLLDSAKSKFNDMLLAPDSEFYDLSPGQMGLWISSQSEETQHAYHIPIVCRINGTLQLSAFDKAFESLLARHEILRTCFIMDKGSPKQKICTSEEVQFKTSFLDLRNKVDKDNVADTLIRQDLDTPFDLQKDPLLRCKLLQMEDDVHLFLFTIHHIISDGWSIGIIFEEITALYTAYCKGQSSSLPALKRQYKDYSNWQNNLLNKGGLKTQQLYWLRQFQDEVPRIALPTDFPRPEIKTFHGDTHSFNIEGSLFKSIQKLKAENNVSLFMLLIAFVKVLMYKLSGQNDIIIGLPVAGRTNLELEKQLGLYVNTIAFRSLVNVQTSFKDFLTTIKENITSGYENSTYPYYSLLDNLHSETDLLEGSLYDVIVQMQDTHDINSNETYLMNDLVITTVAYENRTSKVDLTFNFIERANSIQIDIEYNTKLFKPNTINSIKNTFRLVCEVISNNSLIRIVDIQVKSDDDEKNEGPDYLELINSTISEDF